MWEPATPQNLRVLKNPPCTRSTFRQSTDGSEYVTAEVNIVEEEQHMLRKLKRGSKIQLDAGRLNAIMQQQVNTPCCCREFDDDDHQRCSLSLSLSQLTTTSITCSTRSRTCKRPARIRVDCCGGASISLESLSGAPKSRSSFMSFTYLSHTCRRRQHSSCACKGVCLKCAHFCGFFFRD